MANKADVKAYLSKIVERLAENEKLPEVSVQTWSASAFLMLVDLAASEKGSEEIDILLSRTPVDVLLRAISAVEGYNASRNK